MVILVPCSVNLTVTDLYIYKMAQCWSRGGDNKQCAWAWINVFLHVAIHGSLLDLFIVCVSCMPFHRLIFVVLGTRSMSFGSSSILAKSTTSNTFTKSSLHKLICSIFKSQFT